MFCRVRPPCNGEAADAAPGGPVLAFPSAGDLAGRGLELSQPPAGGKGGDRDVQAHSFGFDRVFAPSASQVGALLGALRRAAALRPPSLLRCVTCRLFDPPPAVWSGQASAAMAFRVQGAVRVRAACPQEVKPNNRLP